MVVNRDGFSIVRVSNKLPKRYIYSQNSLLHITPSVARSMWGDLHNTLLAVDVL